MIFGSVKLILKFIILLLFFAAFVVFHNTDFGARFERKVGKALEYDSIEKACKSLYSKAKDSSGIEDEAKKVGKKIKKQVDKLKKSDVVKKVPEKAEKIVDEERKKLESILEKGG